MAEKDKKDKPAEQAASDPAPKKGGLPLKTIIVVAVLMVLEGGGLYFILGSLGGPKASQAGTDAKELVNDQSEDTQEIRILDKEDEKFQSHSSGQVWVWNVSVFIQVKNKHSERVDHVLQTRKAEIKEGLSQIIARAQITQLKEPERQSLNRQVSALLEKIIGQDPDGKPLIERVLIPTCSGYPSNY
jgi:flagellar basal body-associated protein FliL